MSTVTVNTPYPVFTDIDGQPLEDGYIWLGVSGLEPQANPQTAYWDAALTQAAAQPVRTRGGYPLNGSAIGQLFTADAYSIKVQNKNASTIVLDLTGAAGGGVTSISFGTTGLTPAVASDGDVVVAGTLAVANGGTGITSFGAGVATWLGTPSSANLRAALTDETGTGSAVFATSPTVSDPAISSGNLTFSGTAQRITGDMSNATVANRLAFQSSTTNGATQVNLIPNGTSVDALWFSYANSADLANSQFASFGVVNGENRITAGITGAASYAPMTFYTGGSERMRIDSSGNVGIGTASPGAKLDVYAASGGLTSYIRNAGSTGSDTANSYVVAGSTSIQNLAYGNGISYTVAAATNVYIIGNSANAPVTFSSNNTERMRITASGNIVAGASAALATNATDGFLYVPTCAGTPTGTPTAITGMAPIVVNTTNNKLYFYSGGSWRDAGP